MGGEFEKRRAVAGGQSGVPAAPALRSGRRRLAIGLAVGALYPWALTTSWSHASGGMSVGSGNTWSISYHNVVNRPVVLLGFAAVGLWVTAAALWAGRSRLLTGLAAGLAASLCVSSFVVSANAPRVLSAAPATLLAQVRLHESEAAVVAALGPAPQIGGGTNVRSGESLPCLLYPTSAGAWGSEAAFCFRNGVVAFTWPAT